MKESIVKKLKIIQEEHEMDNLILGEYFLYGRKVIFQLEDKKVGDPITYYKIISKNKKGVEFTPVYDILERD